MDRAGGAAARRPDPSWALGWGSRCRPRAPLARARSADSLAARAGVGLALRLAINVQVEGEGRGPKASVKAEWFGLLQRLRPSGPAGERADAHCYPVTAPFWPLGPEHGLSPLAPIPVRNGRPGLA